MTDKVRKDLNDFLVKCLYELSNGADTSHVFDQIKYMCDDRPRHEHYIDKWFEGEASSTVLAELNRYALDNGTLMGMPDFERIAFLLETSTQTVRRGLAKEGESFTRIKREFVLRYGAIRYRTGLMNMTNLGHKLGYSHEAFNVFIKNATGKTPLVYFDSL